MFLGLKLFLNKKFSKGSVRKKGRNNKGRLVIGNKGGGLKINRFFLNSNLFFKSNSFIFFIMKFTVTRALIGLVYYDIGLISTLLLEDSLNIGMCLKNFDSINKHRGMVNYLKNFEIGQYIFNFNISVNSKLKYVRAPGNFAVIFSKKKGQVVLKLRSGWLITVPDMCIGSLGIVSNSLNKDFIIGKAGINRNFGKRPKVRGVAMNPVDHPHGGGEGKKKPKRAKTPWGRLTKNFLTKRKKKFLKKKKKYKIF